MPTGSGDVSVADVSTGSSSRGLHPVSLGSGSSGPVFRLGLYMDPLHELWLLLKKTFTCRNNPKPPRTSRMLRA